MVKFGLIGYPIAHSGSPRMFADAYPDHKGEWVYDLIENPDFESAWNSFLKEYRAINITAPFKGLAAERADLPSGEVLKTGAANIALKTPDGIAAYNSDYLGVKLLLKGIIEEKRCGSAIIVGGGGAGRAAKAAAEDLGLEAGVIRHDALWEGAAADIIIYTLPKAVEGIDRLECSVLIEANYKDPCLEDAAISDKFGNRAQYIGGMSWLKAQAETGYEIMTGQKPKFF